MFVRVESTMEFATRDEPLIPSLLLPNQHAWQCVPNDGATDQFSRVYCPQFNVPLTDRLYNS